MNFTLRLVERRAADVTTGASAILVVAKEVAVSEVRLVRCCVDAETMWAWRGAEPGRGGGGGGGHVVDALVGSPPWPSPLRTRGAGPLSRRPGGPGSVLGVARPRLRRVLWPEALRAWGAL